MGNAVGCGDKSCKAKNDGCTQSHQKHYCRNCNDSDSDHLAHNCQNQQQKNQNPNSKITNNTNYTNGTNKIDPKNIILFPLNCKVNNCTENHPNHYCKNCSNKDSDHFSRNCPNLVQNLNQTQNPNMFAQAYQTDNIQNFQNGRFGGNQKGRFGNTYYSVPPKDNSKRRNNSALNNSKNCNATGCIQNHESHYCKFCGDEDSDHLSKFCPQISSKILRKARQGCRVNGCTDKHNSHFCKICLNNDSNHKAVDCNQGSILYHGTTEDIADLIMNGGFKASTTGRMGPGIYFTPQYQIAKLVAINRGKKYKNKQPVVIVVNVACKDKTYAQQGTHPIWKGTTTQPFQQVCVKDNKYLRIKQIKKV